jgi:hypothetical protein
MVKKTLVLTVIVLIGLFLYGCIDVGNEITKVLNPLPTNICADIGEGSGYGNQAKCIGEIAISQKNVALCHNLAPQDIDACYDYYAIAYRDESICDKISGLGGNGQSYNCAGGVFGGVFCSTIDRRYDRYQCLENVAIVKNDSAICGKITGDDDAKNVCLGAVTRNLSICKEVKRDDLHWLCGVGIMNLIYEDTANAQNNYSICSDLGSSRYTEFGSYGAMYEKLSCLEKISVERNDTSACSYLYNLSTYDLSRDYEFCSKEPNITEMAVKQKDVSVCKELLRSSGTILEDHCKLKVAIETGNVKICLLILEDSYVNECYKTIIGGHPVRCNQLNDYWGFSCK